MKHSFAPIGTATIFHQESGSGDLVLFIHAGVADSRMWLPQLKAVPDGHRFVAFDLRGFGESKLGGDEYSDHLDALALMDHLQADSAVVVGCSIGSAIAVQMAATAPERIKGLVLVGADSPGFEPSEAYESPEWPQAIAAFEAGDMERVAYLDAEMWLAGNGRSAADIDPGLVELLVSMDLKALATESARDGARVRGPDLLESLSGLDCPVMVIVGSNDLPTLVEAAHDLATKHSGREAVVIAHTAHLPGLEQPEAFNSALFSFLEMSGERV